MNRNTVTEKISDSGGPMDVDVDDEMQLIDRGNAIKDEKSRNEFQLIGSSYIESKRDPVERSEGR